MMKTKRTAHLKTININIASCSYDSILYRANIYNPAEINYIRNILTSPIYIRLPKEKAKDLIQINLSPFNIITKGDFLVTLEYIKDLGDGYLNFCSALLKKSYCRNTSQGNWYTVPVGIGISVIADVEK